MGDGFSVAWRVLDAQYWGVPQRRKRIYLVADFGGERAGKILFERDGLSGHPQPGQAAREGTADDAPGSTGRSDRVECLNPWDVQSCRQYAVDGAFPALQAHQGGRYEGVCFALDSMSSNSMKSGNPHSGFHEETVAKTLQAGGVDPTCNQGGNVIVEPLCFKERAGCPGGGKGILINKDGGTFTLSTLNDQTVCVAASFMGSQGAKAGGIGINRPALVYDARGNGNGTTVPTLTGDHQNRVTDYTSVCVMAHGQSNAEITQDMSPTLNCNHEQSIVAKSSDKPPRRYIVRRLTPLECCRLQGFPDGWADIDRKDDFTDEELDFWRSVRNTHATINGKQTKEYTKPQMLKWYNGLQSDSSVYKMWGNGIALPCAQYVMEGIALALKGENMDALRL